MKKGSSVIRVGENVFIDLVALVSISDLCKCLDRSTKPSDGHRALNGFPTRSTTVQPDSVEKIFGKLNFDTPTVSSNPVAELNAAMEESRKFAKKLDDSFKRWETERKDRWLNNSMIGSFSKYFDSELFILLGFLASLLMVLLVWGLLFCCHKRSRASATSELFASSTPINAYSPINSTMPSNISPISMHGDQARAALLDGSLYNMDVVPSCDDNKPPSYEDAVRNPA